VGDEEEGCEVKPANYWKQVREVCDKATAGPWKVMKCRWAAAGEACSVNQESAVNYYDDTIFKSDNYDECTHIVSEPDAAFIALARTALPEALDEIDSLRAGQQNDDRDHRRLTAEIERLREVLGRLSSPSWPCEVVQDMNAMSRRADAQLVAEKTVGEMSGIARAALGKP
jgi:hypothetical protein